LKGAHLIGKSKVPAPFLKKGQITLPPGLTNLPPASRIKAINDSFFQLLTYKDSYWK